MRGRCEPSGSRLGARTGSWTLFKIASQLKSWAIEQQSVEVPGCGAGIMLWNGADQQLPATVMAMEDGWADECRTVGGHGDVAAVRKQAARRRLEPPLGRTRRRSDIHFDFGGRRTGGCPGLKIPEGADQAIEDEDQIPCEGWRLRRQGSCDGTKEDRCRPVKAGRHHHDVSLIRYHCSFIGRCVWLQRLHLHGGCRSNAVVHRLGKG